MRFLFVDRILELIPGQLIRGLKHVTTDDYYLSRDEAGRPCFIASFIGEALGQLAAWNVMAVNQFTRRPVAGVVDEARLYRPVRVGETLLLESFIDALDEVSVRYRSVARVGQEVVFSIDNALGPLLPMDQFISEVKVRRQFLEIDRPGDWAAEQAASSCRGSLDSESISLACPPMRFDCVLENEPAVSLCAEKRISRAAPYFRDHFPYMPVLPMTVLLECQLNLTKTFLQNAAFEHAYQVREMRKIKMNTFVHPGDKVTTHLKVKRHEARELVLSCRSEVDGKRVCVLEIVLTAEGDYE